MFDLKEYIAFLWSKRMFIFLNFVLAVVAAVYVVFFVLQSEYRSTATFLPPAGSINPLMAMGGRNLPMGMLGGVDDDNVEVIFDSRALKRNIIDEFNLIENYKLENKSNNIEEAIRRMRRQITLKSTSKGSGAMGTSRIISYNLDVFHTCPDTALMIAEFIFEHLDSAMIDISVDKARRNREFMEEQFNANKARLDSLQNAMMEFQIEHKIFDINEQMKLSMQVYAEVKAAAVMNDLRLMTLRQEFRENAPEIIAAQNAKRSFERTLAELEQSTELNALPSLNLSSELAPQYINLYREVEVQNQIYRLLARELEQARLQEARDVSPLMLVDAPFRAQYRARPIRWLMILAIVFAEILFFFSFLTYYFYVKYVLTKSDAFKEFVKSIKQGERN